MLLFTLAIQILAVLPLISGACVDSVSRKRFLYVNDKDGNRIDKAESCAEIMKKWPSMCESSLVGGRGGRCCVSCGNPKCLDKLTRKLVMTVGSDKVESCEEMVRKYPVQCKTADGKKGGRCCRACKNVKLNLKCVDALKVWPLNGKLVPCSKYVANEPCRCTDKQIKKSCCASCKDASLDGCDCRDSLSNSRPATISLTFGQNLVVNKDVTNCKDIAQYYSQLCDTKHLGGKKNTCCKSCVGVDPMCRDDLTWKVSVEGCQKCNCHQLRKAGKKIMRKVCKANMPGDTRNTKSRDACCLQCRRLGFKSD